MATTEEQIQEAAKKYRNWSKWGSKDELGTLNYITPEKIIEAARLSARARSFRSRCPLIQTDRKRARGGGSTRFILSC
jgi:hypothetical protein